MFSFHTLKPKQFYSVVALKLQTTPKDATLQQTSFTHLLAGGQLKQKKKILNIPTVE